MNKKQADIEARKIFEWYQEQCDQIVEEAKKNKNWNRGLDSNNFLFTELKKETKGKLNRLYSMIDEN